jgi:hypothetical protein
VPELESNAELVKLFRDAIATYADAIRREILPATGDEADELKWNMYEFYLGDTAADLAGGVGEGAKKLFLKYLDEFLDQERAKAKKKPATRRKKS